MKKLLLALVTAALVVTVSGWGANVKPPIKEVKEFQVMGIAVRTSNAREATPNGEIPRQWQKFFQENILAKIPHKVDSSVYAVYTDYADRRAGEYTFLIGAKVGDASVVPAGLVVKTIPAGKFAVFTSETGPAQKVVPQAWQKIWELEDSSNMPERAYRADYELYDQRSQNPAQSQVDIYIGLR